MSADSPRRVPVAILGTRGLPPRYGGAETATDELGRRLVERGHDVVVYCRTHNSPQPHPEQHHGVRLVHLPSLHTKNFDTPTNVLIGALHLVVRERARVVLLSGVGVAFIVPFLRLCGRRTVIWADGQDWRRGKWGRFARAYLRLSAWFACRTADGIVTDTTIARDFYRAELHRETTCIPHGANIEDVQGTDELLKWGVVPGRYMLFVGRLIPEKGVHYLIEAFERLETDCRLVIVGDSPYTPDYVQKLRATRDPRIVFTGYVFGEGFKQLMRHCRIYVQPSDVEGTSPVLLTAMGYGRPVVVNGIPENRATVGEAGLAFEPGDVEGLRRILASILDDAGALQALSRASEERVRRHFSWDRITDAFERLFDELDSGRTPGPGIL